MKYVMKLIKRVCLGVFGIYSVNVIFSAINVLIPINFVTICMSSFLGVFGIMALVLLKFLI